jgi:DNA-directed RNA polymerase subunit RPC12/RpoP
MAVKTSCPYCKKSFSAPDEYRGRKIECPRCGRRSVLRTAEDLQTEAEQAAVEQKKQDADRERLALVERLTERRARRSGRPLYEEFQTGTGSVRHYNPGAPSRFLRFRALSDLLVLAAYVELLLVAAGVGLTVYLWLAGQIPSAALLFVCLVGWLILGTGAYLVFKYLGEMAFLLADVGDQQNDLVQLLIDLRENTDREAEADS